MEGIPARLVEGELLILGGALGSVEGMCYVLLELAHEHVRRQARVAHLLDEEQVHRCGGGTVTARRFERER